MAIPKSLVTSHFTEQIHKPNPPLQIEDSRFTLTNSTTKENRGRRSVVLSISATLLAQVSSSSSSAAAAAAAKVADFFNLFPEPEPERTLQSAQEGIRKSAGDILGTKEMMIEKKLWREAQKELRRSSGNMKQDLYLIIQSKPPKERPLLRNLYSNLFNTITKLDYAARDEDEAKVLEYYKHISKVLDDIFSLIQV